MPDPIKYSIAHSESAYAAALRVMPGGVSSPVRAFKAVGGTPIFMREGHGCTVKDLDGNQYIDFIASYGALIVGHSHERVVAALSKAIGRGTSLAMPTELETQLAELIISAVPSLEMLRFVNSGTEAVMSAIRLARAATGREKIVKCAGCYHGHSDGLLVQAGSGALTLGAPSSPGVPASVAANTVVMNFNDLAAARAVFAQYPKQLAAILIEPIVGNMGVVPPADGYLQGLRKLCDDHGTLLIIDEVMTGFRVAWGGAQVLYRVQADLTCLGKIIGGGLPVGAYGGSRALMQQISPAGPVYQAGTLSGNPLAMSAGLATLEMLKEPGVYETLETRSNELATGLLQAAATANVPLCINRVGSMLTPFFVNHQGDKVQNFPQATSRNTQSYATFFHAMLEEGIHLAPSQYEAMFVGTAHGQDEITKTIDAAGRAMKKVG